MSQNATLCRALERAPVVAVAGSGRGTVAALDGPIGRAHALRFRILVAEDDSEMRRVIADTLRDDGNDVVELADGGRLRHAEVRRYNETLSPRTDSSSSPVRCRRRASRWALPPSLGSRSKVDEPEENDEQAETPFRGPIGKDVVRFQALYERPAWAEHFAASCLASCLSFRGQGGSGLRLCPRNRRPRRKRRHLFPMAVV
jgi:hypothetical protein